MDAKAVSCYISSDVRRVSQILQTANPQLPVLHKWRPRDGQNMDFMLFKNSLEAGLMSIDINPEVLDHSTPTKLQISRTHRHLKEPQLTEVLSAAIAEYQAQGTIIFNLIKPALLIDGTHQEIDRAAIQMLTNNSILIRDGRGLLDWAHRIASLASLEARPSHGINHVVRNDLQTVELPRFSPSPIGPNPHSPLSGDSKELEAVLLEQIELLESQPRRGSTGAAPPGYPVAHAAPIVPSEYAAKPRAQQSHPPQASLSAHPYRQLAPAASSFAMNEALLRHSTSERQVPEPLREQDRLLPMANVARLMNKRLPPGAKVAKNAKQLMQELASEFICFVTAEANDVSLTNKCRAVAPEDVFAALNNLDLAMFTPPLEEKHRAMKQSAPSKHKAEDHMNEDPAHHYQPPSSIPDALFTCMQAHAQQQDWSRDSSRESSFKSTTSPFTHSSLDASFAANEECDVLRMGVPTTENAMQGMGISGIPIPPNSVLGLALERTLTT